MLMALSKAFRDAKRDGVDIPKISVFCGSWTTIEKDGNGEERVLMLEL